VDGAEGELKMSLPSKADVIRAIFAAYLANDRKHVEDAFADDFRFTSPFDDNLDKATYFARCWKNSDWIAQHELEKIIVQGDEAFVTYRCLARDGRSFRNTEFFRFAGDKVSQVDVYFGPAYENGRLVKQGR
jgi:ketosteroid isomerase-like protein